MIRNQCLGRRTLEHIAMQHHAGFGLGHGEYAEPVFGRYDDNYVDEAHEDIGNDSGAGSYGDGGIYKVYLWFSALFGFS